MSTSELMQGVVLAVCAGRAAVVQAGDRAVRTAFVKEAIEGPVRVTALGVTGDEHVYDKHGGPDMAVLVYSHDHYEHWHSVGLAIPSVGAFGENLTVTGLVEIDVHIGDVFEVGSAVLQVTQPRSPCSKIAARYGVKNLAVQVQRTGFTGYLLRVLAEGDVTAGDEMLLVERQSHGVTVAEAGRVLNVDRNDHDAARRLLEVDALASSVHQTLRARLADGQQLGLDLPRLFDAG
jgi:MOSC domain-containing protein YiiM